MKLAIAAIVFTSQNVFAGSIACYENPRTNAYQCFDEKQVREKDGIRIASLYTGGPNGVEKTNFTINVNCKTEVVHLKDRYGVSFAGGYGSETPALRTLRQWICDAKPLTLAPAAPAVKKSTPAPNQESRVKSAPVPSKFEWPAVPSSLSGQ